MPPMLAEPSPRQLDEALSRRAAGATLAEAVGITPAAEELERMLGLTDEFARLPAAGSDPGVRVRVRSEYARAGQAHRAAWVHNHTLPHRPAKHRVPTHPFRWSFVVGMALILALIAGSTLALAAQLAEPDSSLYPLKLNTEKMLVATGRTPTGRANVRIELATQRYRDAEAMAAKGKGTLAVQAMHAYYVQLRSAAAELAVARHDAGWKGVRDQFAKAETKSNDVIVNQLQNSGQKSAVKSIQGLESQFAKDRKAIDTQLSLSTPTVPTTPQPLPSGAQPQPPSPTP